MENKWKRKEDVMIPPVMSEGFQEMVIIRKPIAPVVPENEEELTSVLMSDEDNEPTVLLREEPSISYRITRKSTGEEYAITSFPVSLGKGSACDFILRNNKAISRRHAQIREENKKYYLSDLGSSNHTFINDEIIDESVEIRDGSQFRLADELFEFHEEVEVIK